MNSRLLIALSMGAIVAGTCVAGDKDASEKRKFNKYETTYNLLFLMPLTYLSYKALTATSSKVLEDKAKYAKKSHFRYHQYRQDKNLGNYAQWLLKHNAPRVKYVAMQTVAASALCVTTTLSAVNLASRYLGDKYYSRKS